MKTARRYAPWALVILAIGLVRETGCISLTFYRTSSQGNQYSCFSVLNHFSKIGLVTIIDEYGRTQNHRISKDPGIVRLTVKDAITSISPFQWMPLIKFGHSECHYYLAVEKSTDGNGWDRWGYIVPIDEDLNLTVVGFCSAYDYRKLVRTASLTFSDSDFTGIFSGAKDPAK